MGCAALVALHPTRLLCGRRTLPSALPLSARSLSARPASALVRTHLGLSTLAIISRRLVPASDRQHGEVSQAVSVLHDQPPRFAPFLADTVEPQPAEELQLAPVACQGTEIDEAYEDWAAIHHARGAVSEDAEASIDKLWQRRQLQKAMGVHALPHLEPLGTSGANTPTIWTSHFPPAQLRPY
ncbi:hypothetical protein PANT_9c00110 [Moesziomyces antarcticus T-34]|uniref:Uncharacterized protein n=1 Tax=Pseudozyma antarctica (strain T-34) TaxID=1151754 RepID=M9M0K4_PSEA3|nr:hypothetical protein PANT_9c00110 [Moesziomyces antarcticus T-34]